MRDLLPALSAVLREVDAALEGRDRVVGAVRGVLRDITDRVVREWRQRHAERHRLLERQARKRRPAAVSAVPDVLSIEIEERGEPLPVAGDLVEAFAAVAGKIKA